MTVYVLTRDIRVYHGETSVRIVGVYYTSKAAEEEERLQRSRYISINTPDRTVEYDWFIDRFDVEG